MVACISVSHAISCGRESGDDKVAMARAYANYLRRSRNYYGYPFGRCEEDVIVFLSYTDRVVSVPIFACTMVGGPLLQRQGRGWFFYNDMMVDVFFYTDSGYLLC